MSRRGKHARRRRNAAARRSDGAPAVASVQATHQPATSAPETALGTPCPTTAVTGPAVTSEIPTQEPQIVVFERSPHPPYLYMVDAETTTPDMVSHLPLPLLLRLSNGDVIEWPFDETDPNDYEITQEDIEIEDGCQSDDE